MPGLVLFSKHFSKAQFIMEFKMEGEKWSDSIILCSPPVWFFNPTSSNHAAHQLPSTNSFQGQLVMLLPPKQFLHNETQVLAVECGCAWRHFIFAPEDYPAPCPGSPEQHNNLDAPKLFVMVIIKDLQYSFLHRILI